MKVFSKYLICFAVIVAFALCIGIQQAKANEALLFPYFKSGGGAFTFISIQKWANEAGSFKAANDLHAVYYYDLLNTPALECIHSDSFGTLTPQDLLQYEVTKQVDVPAITGDKSTVPYLNLPPGNPVQGFMILSVGTFQIGGTPTSDFEGNVPGQAVLIDTTTGLVTAYKGLNNPNSTDENIWGPPAFLGQASPDPIAKGSWMMSNYLDPTVKTQWYLLAVGQGLVPPIAPPTWTGRVVLENGYGLVWDMDEKPQSSQTQLVVNCFAFFDRTTIMDLTAQNQTGLHGGMWWERINVPAFLDPPANTKPNPATGAIMAKFESTTALGSKMQAVSLENAFPNFPY